MVLVLFETAVGFCLFQVTSPGSASAVLSKPDLHKHFSSASSASAMLSLSAIHRFTSAAEATADAADIGEGKVSKGLKKFLTEQIKENKSRKKEELVVVDPKLGGAISKKLGINVVSDSSVLDLYRGIRTHLAALLVGADGPTSDSGALDPRDLSTMSLGLSHSLSRYKLKFSPDKVDTMVVQAIGLLDDLDKEVNIYAMRVKEWYGWHFPEMAKIVADNIAYAKCILAMGFRTSAAGADLSDVLPEEVEETLKAAAEISMGTEISDVDLQHIQSLCEQVVSIAAYRAQLYAYLQARMARIAPNLTALVGELVGARLIAHAGSLMHLAKQPASTVQILGAEKALFRALKTKHDTPKYGLIYHASLVGQAPQKLKGKMARMVATKAALSIRLDALADAETKAEHATDGDGDADTVAGGKASIGADARVRLEAKLRQLEGGAAANGAAAGRPGVKQAAYRPSLNGASGRAYNAGADATSAAAAVAVPSEAARGKKRAGADAEDEDAEDSEAGLSKEERRARKKARKEAKKAAKAGADTSAISVAASSAAGDETAATSINGDGDDTLSKEARKAAKKAKKAAKAAAEADASTASAGEPKKKKKKSE